MAKALSVTFETELVTSDRTGPVYHYMYVEKDQVKPLDIKGITRRVICTLNEKVTFPCSLMGNAKGGYKISVNKEHRDTAGIVPGSTCLVKLVRDDSEYGIPVPPELTAVLDQDPEGKKLFGSITNGRQRVVVWHVDKARAVDERIRRALIMIEHLKNNGGHIDDSRLYQDLKKGGPVSG